MANTVCITVQKIFERNKRYSILGDDEEWYGMGFDRPSFNEGDEIQFNFTKNGKYKNVDASSIEVTNAGESKPAGNKKATSSDVMSKDDYWRRKEEGDVKTQREIRYQASRNAAIEFVRLGLEQDILPLSRTKADKEEQLDMYVKTYTDMFYRETVAIRDKSDEALDAETILDFDEGDDLRDLVE